jgi:hypothetical protein
MKMIRNVSAVVVALASTVAYSGTASLLFTGRVDSVDASAGSLSVLGHSIKTADARRVLPGQLVNVYGVIATDGSIANVSLESVANYSVAASDATGLNRVVGLTGTGDQAEGLTGTGDQAEGLTGTGDQAEGLTGTGDQAEGLTGTGDQAEGLTGTGDSSG